MMMKSVFWWRKPETSVKLFYLPSADIEEALEDEKAIRKALRPHGLVIRVIVDKTV